MHKNLELFTSQFNFQGNSGKGLVGCEREFFTNNHEGKLFPLAPLIYPHLERFGCGYELSACQLELRVGPCIITDFHPELIRVRGVVEEECRKNGCHPNFESISPDDMPLEVFPDPTGRYASIAEKMPREKLLAACQITGTHVHIGMPDLDTAIRVHDRLLDHVDELIEVGDLTQGRRMEIYKVVTPQYLPERFGNAGNMLDLYTEAKCEADPRSWWRVIRISKHGTIELRMFDNTCDDQQVYLWAKKCHELCFKFM